ncbi:MAG: hypothetical protein B6A08_17175 [Sorangiineae bacterium NIC37A_2]|nr:MAG: hypothetical protein B6A08_18650 [Sorangiineae bacterium NIC37A_2]OQX67095.1 MAG: hypothetical protein B6A08_17175 [Sorangiineae bacterium NIC37A_2]
MAEHSDQGSNSYPFASRRQVAERLRTDRAFLLQAVRIMCERNAARIEGASGVTGWGSSDARKVEGPAKRLLEGSASEEDFAVLICVVPRYSRPIAAELRTEAMRDDVRLQAVAKRFGVQTPEGQTTNEASEDAAESVSPLEAAINGFLVAQGKARSGEIVAALQMERQPVVDCLRRMTDQGRLRRTGQGGGTYYEIPV